MARVIDPKSAEGIELQKWEMHNSHWQGEVIPAGNPFTYREYPKMLYRAQKREGKVQCMEAPPNPYHYLNPQEYDRAALISEHFNKSCQRIVGSEGEELVAKGQGWCVTPLGAIEQFEREEQAIGDAAAEANYAVKRMSERAQREHQAATDSTYQHVTDIQPKKRGRKAKAIVAVEDKG